MSKFKITRKDLKGERCYVLGYAELKALFTSAGIDPIAYNAGVYGWNYDVYMFNSDEGRIYILTGYRGMFGRRIDFDLVKKYEALRERTDKKWVNIKTDAFGDFETWYKTRRAEYRNLVDEFIAEVVKG